MIGEIENRTGLPLIPLRSLVVFPFMATPLEVGREFSIAALDAAKAADNVLILAAQKDPKDEEPDLTDIYQYGTLCRVKHALKLPSGVFRILIEGLRRVRIENVRREKGYFQVDVELVAARELDDEDLEVQALGKSVTEQFKQYVKLSRKKMSEETMASVSSISAPGRLADVVAAQVNGSVEEKQMLLEKLSVKERLESLYGILNRELNILDLEQQIHQRVRKQMEKIQREHYLREQMKAIQKELGEKDDRAEEVDQYRQQVKKAKLPKVAREKAEHEINRLERMPPMAAESVVVRTYLDWLLAMPWSKASKDSLDIVQAEEILDEDHYGLTKVKQRILEFLAVRKLTKQMKGSILCFVGPPGVGKTSLAKSIARCMGRQFVRLSLGGVRDEAEIRGHRRTYIGAMPGKILQSMKTAKTRNPVILLDEVDKMASDFRGDPAAALLEVLDPEQNSTFTDHYLELEFDLSRVLFITTANVLPSIPPALRDRMEVLHLPGYTAGEKLQIGKGYLWPKQLRAHGLDDKGVSISDNTFMKLIEEYTREAGVRNLERELASICRKVATNIVKGEKRSNRVTVNTLDRYLGVPRFRQSEADKKDMVGVATGLAYTQVGGEILSIEVTVVSGKGNLTLTGKLGDVMKESAQAAISYVRSRSKQLGISQDFYEKFDLHIHIPEGAVPKDGPSAGITIATALASALSGRAVRCSIAMTGELTLRGRVLPVGGIKEKLLAAHRFGVKQVLVPQANVRDLEEIPESVRRQLQVDSVEHMDQVLEAALLPVVHQDAHVGLVSTSAGHPTEEQPGVWIGDPS